MKELLFESIVDLRRAINVRSLYISPIKTIKVKKPNTCFLVLSEKGTSLAYKDDLYPKKVRWILPLNRAKELGIKPIYKTKLSKDMLKNVLITDAILKNGRPAAIDLNAAFYYMMFKYRSLKKHSPKFVSFVYNILKNIKEYISQFESYENRVIFNYVIDLNKFPDVSRISKTFIKQTFLYSFFRIISNKNKKENIKFPFDNIFMTIIAGDFKATYLVYLEGKEFSLVRIIKILNTFLKLRKTSTSKVNETKSKMIKIVKEYLEKKGLDEGSNATVVESIQEYLDSNPEAVMRFAVETGLVKYDDNTTIRAVVGKKEVSSKKEIAQVLTRGLVTEVLKATEAEIPSTPKEIDRLIKTLLTVRPPKYIFDPQTIEPNDTFTSAIVRPKIIGNVFNARPLLLKDVFASQVKLFNSYYLPRYRMKLVGISSENVESNNIYDSEIISTTLKLRDLKTGKVHKVKINLPKLVEDKYFIQNGKARAIIYQVFPNPVLCDKPFEVSFRNNYATVRYFVKMKGRRNGAFVHIVGVQNVPYLVMVLSVLTSETKNPSIEDVLKSAGIKGFKVSDDLKDLKKYAYSFPWGNKVYYLPETAKAVDKQIIWSFRLFLRKYKDKIESLDLDKLMRIIYEEWGQLFVNKIRQLAKYVIDPLTLYILKGENLPTDFLELSRICIEKASVGEVTQQTDLKTRRIRVGEVIAAVTFKKLTLAIDKYEKTNRKGEIKIDPDEVIRELNSGSVQSQYQLVSDNNPLAEIRYSLRTTYAGLEGMPTENAPMSMRNTDPTYYGSIDPLDTPDSKGVGVIRHIAINADLIGANGKFVIKPTNKKTNPFSITLSQVPFAVTNDGNRLQFVNSQLQSDMPLKNSERPFLATVYSSLPLAQATSSYAIRALSKGRILEVDNDYILVEYEVKNRKIKHIHILNERDVHENDAYSKVIPIVKEGDRVKKNQVIAKSNEFFKGALYSPGINAYVAQMPYDIANFEDGIVISESFAKKMVSSHGVNQEIYINETDAVVDVVLEIGKEVKKYEPLLKTYPKAELGNESSLRESIEDVKNNPISSKEFIFDSNEDLDEPEVSDDSSTDYIVSSFGKEYYPKYDGVIEDIIVVAKSKEILKKYPKLYNFWKKRKKEVEKKLNELKKKGYDVDPLKVKYRLILNPFGLKDRKDDIENIKVIYKIVAEKPVEHGDKLHNRYGNKGVVSKILPDDKMPRDENGIPFDIIINPNGIISRMNPGQIHEMYFGKIIKFVNNKIQQMNPETEYNKIIDEVVKLYKNLLSRTNKEIVEQVTHMRNLPESRKKEIAIDVYKNGIVLFVEPTDKPDLKSLIKTADSYGIKLKEKVYYPDLKRYSRKPVPVGWMYWLKTSHLAYKKYHARSIGPYQSKYLQAVRGSKQEGGQRLGEYETSALASYDLKNFLIEISSLSSDDIETKFKAIHKLYKDGTLSLKDLKNSKSAASEQFRIVLECMGVLEPKD